MLLFHTWMLPHIRLAFSLSFLLYFAYLLRAFTFEQHIWHMGLSRRLSHLLRIFYQSVKGSQIYVWSKVFILYLFIYLLICYIVSLL